MVHPNSPSGGVVGPLIWHGKHVSISSFTALSILGNHAYWRNKAFVFANPCIPSLVLEYQNHDCDL
jgi:hypothetical protein